MLGVFSEHIRSELICGSWFCKTFPSRVVGCVFCLFILCVVVVVVVVILFAFLFIRLLVCLFVCLCVCCVK